MSQQHDLLNEHLKVLKGVGAPSLDDGFYGRLRNRMEVEAIKRDRKMVRGAAWAASILLLILMFNLYWLRPSSGDQAMPATDGIGGFAVFYDQSISTDL
jgi:hypothetical protein